MTPARRTLRQTLTIARRDFIATVFTPVFLIFLFAPVLIGSFGAIGGLATSGTLSGGGGKFRVVAIVPDAQARPLADADAALRAVFRTREDQPPALVTLRPAANAMAQARAAFAGKDYDASAVMLGPLNHPHLLYRPSGTRAASYLAALAEHALATERLGTAARVNPVRIELPARDAPSAAARSASGGFAVFGIFFLTLFLSGQTVGSMAEERNNKVIEVLAAAVPLESVFFGKLLGMFGVALVFVAFWGTLLGAATSLIPPGFAQGLAELKPAVGPIFPLLFFAYFTMAYLLLGAVFLGIGAQATSMREIQLLSLPITILQIAMLGLSTAAVSHPGTPLATAAELFPLSSPFAMAGRAAGRPELWPHLLALAWQAMWVAIFVTIGARAFRRGVLQSGSARPRWFGRRREAAATA